MWRAFWSKPGGIASRRRNPLALRLALTLRRPRGLGRQQRYHNAPVADLLRLWHSYRQVAQQLSPVNHVCNLFTDHFSHYFALADFRRDAGFWMEAVNIALLISFGLFLFLYRRKRLGLCAIFLLALFPAFVGLGGTYIHLSVSLAGLGREGWTHPSSPEDLFAASLLSTHVGVLDFALFIVVISVLQKLVRPHTANVTPKAATLGSE